MSNPTGPVFRVVTIGEESERREGKTVIREVISSPAVLDMAKVSSIIEREPFSDGSTRIMITVIGGSGGGHASWYLKMSKAELVALIPPEWLS